MNRTQKRDQFIENLEKFQITRGYNSTEFAQILKVKKQQWGRWKLNKIGITLTSMHKLVETLNKEFETKWTLSEWLQDKLPEVKNEEN